MLPSRSSYDIIWFPNYQVQNYISNSSGPNELSSSPSGRLLDVQEGNIHVIFSEKVVHSGLIPLWEPHSVFVMSYPSSYRDRLPHIKLQISSMAILVFHHPQELEEALGQDNKMTILVCATTWCRPCKVKMLDLSHCLKWMAVPEYILSSKKY